MYLMRGGRSGMLWKEGSAFALVAEHAAKASFIPRLAGVA